MTPGNPAFGGTVLRIPAEQSPNYVAGVSGWFIGQNGFAEFNDLTVRGGVSSGGTDLYYDGAPAAGNLVGSVSGAGGADGFGNAYLAGFVSYFPATVYALQLLNNEINLWTAASQAGPYARSSAGIALNDLALGVGEITLGGQVLAVGGTPANPTLVTTDAPNSVTPPAGMTGTIAYQLLPTGQVSVDVHLAVAATMAAGTVALITGLGLAYQPARDQRGGGVGFFPNGAPTVAQLTAIAQMRWEVTTAGTVNVLAFVGGAAGSGVTELDFTITYPLA